MDESFNVVLSSVCSYLVDSILKQYSSEILVCNFLWCPLALLSACCCLPKLSFYSVFWKSLRSIGIHFSLNIWWHSPVKTSGSEPFCGRRFLIPDSISLLIIILFRLSISSWSSHYFLGGWHRCMPEALPPHARSAASLPWCTWCLHGLLSPLRLLCAQSGWATRCVSGAAQETTAANSPPQGRSSRAASSGSWGWWRCLGCLCLWTPALLPCFAFVQPSLNIVEGE